MGLWTDKSIEVETVDDGWVLSWTDETKRKLQQDYWTSSRPVEPKTRGREVFHDKKKLMKRIEALL